MQEGGGAKDGLFEARPKRRAFAHEGRGMIPPFARFAAVSPLAFCALGCAVKLNSKFSPAAKRKILFQSLKKLHAVKLLPRVFVVSDLSACGDVGVEKASFAGAIKAEFIDDPARREREFFKHESR